MSKSPLNSRATAPMPHRKKRLVVHIVDQMAISEPERLWAEYPRSATGYEEGFRKVTYAAFANAINGLAWWLHKELGPGKELETLAYIGPNDIRYSALILGAVKAGYKMLLTSPRNSVPAHENLFNLTNCNVMITPNPHPPAVVPIITALKLRVLTIPSVEELLDGRHSHYPYNKTVEDALAEPLLLLHSSGTTGLPKPIVISHDWVAALEYTMDLKPPEGFTTQTNFFRGARLFTTMPPFHAGAIFPSLLTGLFFETVSIYPPSGVMASAQLLLGCLKSNKIDMALLVPSLVEEVAQNSEILDFLPGNLDRIMYTGGDVPQLTGDKISRKTKLTSLLGTTEFGALQVLYPADRYPTEDWKYCRFNPFGGVDLQYVSDNAYEVVLMRNPDPEREQPVFKLFPHLEEYRTKDLFAPHPSKQGLWTYTGRRDDIITFLNGEKTNPISMEQHISQHPDVRAVLVTGTNRLQAAVLIEVDTDKPLSTAQRAEYIERLWPTIQEANKECPQHAKIIKSHIRFTDHDKPMIRAGKGTIQRHPTLNLYAKEIDNLYADADRMSSDVMADEHLSQSPPTDCRDEKAVSSFIREVIAQLTESIGAGTLDDGEDFFIRGMDSLQAIQLTRHLKRALKIPDLDISTVYTNPSVTSLTRAILKLSTQEILLKSDNEASRISLMQSTLNEYKASIDELVAGHRSIAVSQNPSHGHRVVLLTGSTGAIGSYILRTLLKDDFVSHIYCLNRASDSFTLQVQRLEARGLPTDLPSERVSFLTADLSRPSLGLDPQVYQHLRDEVTDVIHNAWPVNFNLSLPSFRPHLSGVVNLVAFAAASVHSTSIFFLSSVSSIAARSTASIPEQLIEDFQAPLSMGYAESKFIAEHILSHAAAKLPSISVGVARVGQVAGPAFSPGTWNKAEWLPSLVISSLHLGMIPESLGKGADRIDWVPIDVLADTIVELALKGAKESPQDISAAKFFHLANPHPSTWSALLPAVTEVLTSVLRSKGQSKSIDLVPFVAWLQRVRAESEQSSSVGLEEMLKSNPAIKLLAFYRGLSETHGEFSAFPVMDTKLAVNGSQQLRDLKGIRREWMENWTKGWIEL